MDRSVVMATKIRAAFAPCSLGDWPTPLEAQPGLAWLGWPTQVVAMRVAPRIVANSWRTMRLARHAAALLRRAGVGFDVPRSSLRVRIVNAMGPGYGYPTPDGERARTLAAEHGLQLDPTYGAKAFSFFLRQSTGKVKRGVFWQTFPSS